MAHNADRAPDVHNQKGPTAKAKTNSVPLKFIRRHLLTSKWSPEVITARMKQKGMINATCSITTLIKERSPEQEMIPYERNECVAKNTHPCTVDQSEAFL